MIGEVVVVMGKWKKVIKKSDEQASSVEIFVLVRKVSLLCRKFEKFWIAFANLFTQEGWPISF